MNFLNEITEGMYGEKLMQLMKDGTISFGDIVLFGGKMVLIGMCTVFVVLILIWGCLSLFKAFFHDTKNPTNKKESVAAEVAPAPVPVTNYSQSDDEIVAVIAAAIAAAESENVGAKFRVVSFRRK